MDWMYWVLVILTCAGGAVIGRSISDRRWKLIVPAAVWCAIILALIVLRAG